MHNDARYEHFLVCTGCYWIAAFGTVTEIYDHPKSDSICNLCESEVESLFLDSNLEYERRYYSSVYMNNGRCGNGWSGTTDKNYALLLLHGDRNNIGYWINLSKVL